MNNQNKQERQTARNQPKYSLFKNSSYAFSGLAYAIKDEMSFKIELILFAISLVVLSIFDFGFDFYSYVLIIFAGMIVLIVELLNSAIENVVDLITNDYHILAKKAKDIGSSAVLFALSAYILIWTACLMHSEFISFNA